MVSVAEGLTVFLLYYQILECQIIHVCIKYVYYSQYKNIFLVGKILINITFLWLLLMMINIRILTHLSVLQIKYL